MLTLPQAAVLLLLFAPPSELEPPAKPAVLARLAELQPNQAVLLGRADVVGDFNDTARKFDLHRTGPRGRDYTLKVCWAPDRKRALFCGANHAVPHRLNDVWEFDLPSLSWRLLYAPDLPRGYGDLGRDTSDVELREGIFVTKRGGPAVVGHTWWGLTYDHKARVLLFMSTWVTDRKKAAVALGGDPATLYDGPPLWAFDPAAKTWKPSHADKPYPKAIFGGMLEYVPDLNGSLWHSNNWQMRGTWLHDLATDAWRDLRANGDPVAFGGGEKSTFAKAAPEPEQIGCLDAKRKLIIAQREHLRHHYDIAKNEWSLTVVGDKSDGKSPRGHDARSVMYHDPGSGHALLVQFETNALWAYDPDAKSWAKLASEGDAMPTGGKRLAYFDPEQRVLVVIDGVTVWAYRYR